MIARGTVSGCKEWTRQDAAPHSIPTPVQVKRSSDSGAPGPSRSKDTKAKNDAKPSAKKAAGKDAAAGSTGKDAGPQQARSAAVAKAAALPASAAALPASHLLKAWSSKGQTGAGKAASPALARRAPAPQAAPQVAMDTKWEVPKVTRVVPYPQLLEDIRMGRVEEVKYFQMGRTVLALPGKCLVVYRDGTVGEATIDQDDMRCALEPGVHSVWGFISHAAAERGPGAALYLIFLTSIALLHWACHAHPLCPCLQPCTPCTHAQGGLRHGDPRRHRQQSGCGALPHRDQPPPGVRPPLHPHLQQLVRAGRHRPGLPGHLHHAPATGWLAFRGMGTRMHA